MRRLAQELGSGAASLYWHVGDKEELLSLLLDRIVGETQVPEPDPENWQGTVKELARATRAGTSRSAATPRSSRSGASPPGPHSLPILERNLAVLAASKLPPRVIAYAADMFALYVGGVRLRGEHPARSEQASPSSSATTSPRCRPSSSRRSRGLADELTAGDNDERFEFAIDLLVRGLEAMARDA